MGAARTDMAAPPRGERRALGDLTDRIIGCAIAVHRELGPGLDAAAYAACFGVELTAAGLRWERQVPVPVRYRGESIDCGFRLGFLVEGAVAVEVAADRTDGAEDARLETRLRLSGLRAGLFINFNVRLLPQGLIRRVA